MRKGVIGIVSCVLLIAALAVNANAQMCGCTGTPCGGMPGCGMMGGMEHRDMGMMHGKGGMMMGDDHPLWKRLMALGLDDKQKEALKTLHTKMMKEMARKRADLQIAEIDLRDLLDKDAVDMKAVETSLKKKEALKTEMFLAHVRAHEEMKAILTPEQRKKLKEMGGPGCAMMRGMPGAMEHEDMPMHEHEH